MNRVLVFVSVTIFLFSCGAKDHEKPTYDLRSFFEGKNLYKWGCQSCHGEDGNGRGRLYPPLNNSDYLEKHIDDLPCIIANGMAGEIFVNGQDYNVRMIGFRSDLSDQEIKDLSVYVRNAWGNSYGDISEKEMSESLMNCE